MPLAASLTGVHLEVRQTQFPFVAYVGAPVPRTGAWVSNGHVDGHNIRFGGIMWVGSGLSAWKQPPPTPEPEPFPTGQTQ